jgi:hypothetical protein
MRQIWVGVLLIQGRVKINHFSSLIDKTKKKLASWKSKILSKAGKSILIKSSLATQPYYLMNTVRLPLGIISQLERICRDFFWGDNDEGRKLHTVAWHNICRPKNEGGLGFRFLNQMNLAMLGKLVWCLITKKNTLWVNVLAHKYKVLSSTPKDGCSPVWRSICKAYGALWQGFRLDNDTAAWEHDPKGSYTVASGYFHQFSDNGRRFCFRSVGFDLEYERAFEE